jgi:putative ABC transport system permease protein
VHQIDPRVPVSAVATMSELIDTELFAERGLSLAAGVFAVLACALAAVGLYGVMAYMVAQRRREFGIRLAIGATPRRIALLVLREAGAIGIAGLLLGIPCAYAGSKWGQQALYGLAAMQAVVWGGAAMGILAVIMLTAWIPARVAARMNPQSALKEE